MAPTVETQVTENVPEGKINEEQFPKLLTLKNVEPLWLVMSKLVPPTPQPRALPTLWKYKEIRPLLIKAGEYVSAEQAERRVLMLINPAMREAPMCKTTDTLYAGLQHINTGEVAPAHRHTAFALRFIVEGNGGWTGVQGSRLTMERGDVLLTPRLDWHDHGKQGNGPMIWLDGLDLPVFQAFPVNFTDDYEESRYPSEPVGLNTPLKYPWADVQAALDAIPGPHAIYDYVSKKDGVSPVSTVIGAQAERIAPGTRSPLRHETTSYVFHCVKGSGHTIIKNDGKETTIRWEDKDTFCVPSWSEVVHVNEGDSSAYLYNFNDAPLLKNLNIFRLAT